MLHIVFDRKLRYEFPCLFRFVYVFLLVVAKEIPLMCRMCCASSLFSRQIIFYLFSRVIFCVFVGNLLGCNGSQRKRAEQGGLILILYYSKGGSFGNPRRGGGLLQAQQVIVNSSSTLDDGFGKLPTPAQSGNPLQLMPKIRGGGAALANRKGPARAYTQSMLPTPARAAPVAAALSAAGSVLNAPTVFGAGSVAGGSVAGGVTALGSTRGAESVCCDGDEDGPKSKAARTGPKVDFGHTQEEIAGIPWGCSFDLLKGLKGIRCSRKPGGGPGRSPEGTVALQNPTKPLNPDHARV